ncbi:putative reverse transcriptase domain-containing protein [Tanacetum coccineum]
MTEHSQKWHDGTSIRTRSTKTYDGLAVIQAQLNNLVREIKKKSKSLDQGFGDSNWANEQGYAKKGSKSLPISTETNFRDHIKSISTTVEVDTFLIRRIQKLFFKPRQATIPFPSHLYGDCCDEEKGSYGLKDLDAYSIGTTLNNDALPQKEKDIGSFTLPCYINNVCFEKALVDLGASVSVMPFSTYTNLGLGELAHTKLTVELADRTVKHPKGITKNLLVGIGKFVFPVDFIILDTPEDVKVPLILSRPFLSTTHAKIDVFKRKITLRVGDEKIIFKSVKPASISGLEPTIEEGEVVDEPMMDRIETRCDNKIINGLNKYPSYCDFDRKIHINCAFNLKFSCMIGYEYVDANFFPILSINMMTKRFYNSIMKDKVEYKGKNIVGAFMNVPIFVGKFSIVTDFAVVENMDVYHDEGTGDIIVGRPFCKEACMKANRFDGMITIYKGNNNVTYQMARSHPRFKHLTNAQCNKIRPLLKVSAQDKLKGISHPCQNLKGFYKGVLNLGPEYIKDEKVEE